MKRTFRGIESVIGKRQRIDRDRATIIQSYSDIDVLEKYLSDIMHFFRKCKKSATEELMQRLSFDASIQGGISFEGCCGGSSVNNNIISCTTVFYYCKNHHRHNVLLMTKRSFLLRRSGGGCYDSGDHPTKQNLEFVKDMFSWIFQEPPRLPRGVLLLIASMTQRWAMKINGAEDYTCTQRVVESMMDLPRMAQVCKHWRTTLLPKSNSQSYPATRLWQNILPPMCILPRNLTFLPFDAMFAQVYSIHCHNNESDDQKVYITFREKWHKYNIINRDIVDVAIKLANCDLMETYKDSTGGGIHNKAKWGRKWITVSGWYTPKKPAGVCDYIRKMLLWTSSHKDKACNHIQTLLYKPQILK